MKKKKCLRTCLYLEIELLSKKKKKFTSKVISL